MNEKKTIGIRLIIENTNSRRDYYGNVYCYSTIIRASDRQYLRFRTPSRSNTMGVVRQAGFNWDEVFEVEKTLPIREWNRCAREIERCVDPELVKLVRGFGNNEVIGDNE